MTLPTTRSGRSFAAVVLTSAVLLAGCGGDGDGAGAGAGDAQPTGGPAGASSSASAEESSSATGTTESGDASADPGIGTALTEASFFDEIISAQQEAGSYRTTSTTSTAGMQTVLEGEASYVDGELLAAAESSADSPQQIETVMAAGVLYIRAQGMGIPAGKWLAIDSNDPDQADNPLAGLVSLADPERALEAMGEVEALRLVGSEAIDGIETSHYRATMSTDNYAEVLGLPVEAAELLPAKLPFDMWVDARNRPVKYTLAFEVGGTDTRTEQRYSDYGAEIDVMVPPAGSTVSPGDIGA